MASGLQYIQKYKPELEGKLTRGYYVDKQVLDLSFSGTPTKNIFGKNPKDVIEVAVYNANEDLLGWKIVEDTPIYDRVRLEFTNYNGDYTTGDAQVFRENYTTLNDNVLVSPTRDIQDLELDRGTYFVRYCFLNDLVGSFENQSKLVIKEISQTRTEIKVVPECLKTSTKASDVSLNYEYTNLLNKKLPGSTLYNFTNKLLKDSDVRSEEFQAEIKELVDEYDEVIKITIELLGGGTDKDVYINAHQVVMDVHKLYKNVLITKYNNTFTKSDYYIEYLNAVNYTLSIHPRLGRDTTNELIVDFFKTILISLFDVDYLESLFSSRYDTYLNNYLNLGNGQKFPLLGIIPTNENLEDTTKQTPVVLKLYEPLPTDIEVGQRFYISSSIYSDDVMQKCNFFKTSVTGTFKLRGPDRNRARSLTGTKQYKKEELESTEESRLDEATKKISSYFNKNINANDKDYSQFKNFVKYSSATRQLEKFQRKFKKISNLTRKINSAEYMITSLDEDIKNNIVSEKEAGSATSILRNIDLTDARKKLAKELATLSDYERFLYYSDSEDSWPRSKSMAISGFYNKNSLANGVYEKFGEYNNKPMFKHQHGEWYFWWEFNEGVWVLSDTQNFKLSNWIEVKNESYFFPPRKVSEYNYQGFDPQDNFGSGLLTVRLSMFDEDSELATAPEYIPESDAEWKKLDSYFWYKDKLVDAGYFDRQNDEALVLNIPEFLIRDESNEDFVNFLNVIGLHFDELHGYIENMGNSRGVRNSSKKGIPDDLIYYFLNSLGMNFAGQDSSSDDAKKSGVVDKNSISYRRNQIWRRVLNNLPYILKTKGTAASINALLRCYDIPEQLFSLREYGGATEYSDESSNKSAFVFDSFDYGLSIQEENQYIEFPWSYENINAESFEFKIILNESSKELGTDINILFTDDWEFGVKLNPDNNRDYGRFYFKSGNYTKKCPTENEDPIFIFFEGGYEILLQRSERFDSLKRKTISIKVKRKIDNKIVFSETSELIVDEDTFHGFAKPKSLYVGNYSQSNFRGILDRVRIYSTEISEDRFVNHILFSESYDIEDGGSLNKKLLFKTNFNSPHDISEVTNYKTGYGLIMNSAFAKNLKNHARCFNFIKSEFPYDFVGKFKREFAQLPSFGMHVFNNNKIRTETQELVGPLNPYSRSTKKSLDRAGKDSNTVGLFFGPSVPLNEEIIKFFGEFKLGDYIGNPEDYDKSKYKDLENFKKLFFREGFKQVDWSMYLNTLKAYLDPSLFENFEKLLPARTRVISGLVVEPLLLERNKFKGTALSNEIQTNASKFTIIEPTEKVKPLKNINLSGKHRNKKIMSFANEVAFSKKSNNPNTICFDGSVAYDTVKGKSFKENLHNNFFPNSISEPSYGLVSNFGHYYDTGSLYRVEKATQDFYVSTKFNSGLVDYTISTKYYIDLKLENENDFTTSERNNLSSINGRFVSLRNKNKKLVFSNSADTWFIYYEPYVEMWVLINENPFKYENTETLLADGKLIRFYAELDTDGYFPDKFSINVFEEIQKLSGVYTTWSDFFVNKRKTGPINYYKFYSIETSITVANDKLMKLSGNVDGVINCVISGTFSGRYTESTTDRDGTEIITKKEGHVRFSGTKHKLRLNGTFYGTLEQGTVGNSDTGSLFTLSNGFYNNVRYGGCNFSNKQMIGNINDIVEDNPDFVKVNLDLYDSSKITKNIKTFNKTNLIPTPNKVKYRFENKIDANRFIRLKRNSGNVVFYEQGIPKRNTYAKYDNKFYHKTKDIIQQPLLNNIRLKTDIKIETTELRQIELISYDEKLIDTEFNPTLEYRIEYKTTNPAIGKQSEIDFLFKLKYSNSLQTYVCDFTKYSSGQELVQNRIYTGTKLNTTFREEKQIDLETLVDIDEIYSHEKHITKIEKHELISKLNTDKCCVLAYDISENSDTEIWVYFLGTMTSDDSRVIDIHSYDFVQNSYDQFSYGGVNYLSSSSQTVFETNPLEPTGSKIEKEYSCKNDLIEVKHYYHKQIDKNLNIGDEIDLQITANEKMKYYLPVNRELDVTKEDDVEAIIYTKDTLHAISTINIRDKFLTYKCNLNPIFNQAYFPTEKASSKYFLVLGTSEYNGFLLEGFVGRWKSANGQFKTYNRKNKKLTYIHESNNWIVFYSLTTPRCNKSVGGAWVLAKLNPTMFFEKEESEIFNEDGALYMYGFATSEFNSTNDIVNTDIEINSSSFDTIYGVGPDDTDIHYSANISKYKSLCEDQAFVEEQASLRNKEVIDTSFTIIPIKSTFKLADKYGVNYIGARNNILGWSVNVDSVDNKFPIRAVYEKVYPTKDFDVSIEVTYTNQSGKTRPIVKLVGSDVRLSTFSKIEGEYYLISLIRNGMPVYRNAHDYYIWKDTYKTEDGGLSVWAVGSDPQPLTTPEEQLIDKERVVFISSQGVCTTDDFNFRLGYDITPNIYSSQHRNLTIATAFENAELMNSDSGTKIVWGMVRNESACSVCDDTDSPTYDIGIKPLDASSLYIGSRRTLDEIRGNVFLLIECNKLNCEEELIDFYGEYTEHEQSSVDNRLYVNNTSENLVLQNQITGWEFRHLRILNERSTNKLISSKSSKVINRDPTKEYPKYGEYISDAGEIVFLYFEKDEFDTINLFLMSDNENLHERKFIKSNLVKNNKRVWHSDYKWFIFFHINEISGQSGWCVTDILSDKKIKYKERIRDDGLGNDLDEVYGVYYLEKQGEINFDETFAIVSNIKIKFNLPRPKSGNITEQINDSDPSTFTYRIRTQYGYDDETDAFDVRKVLSTTSNKISTNIPIDFNYKPNFFGRDIPGTSIISLKTDGILSDISYPKFNFDLDFLGNKLSEEIEIRLNDTYDRINSEESRAYNYDFISNKSDEDTTNTLVLKKYKLNKEISETIPEILKISFKFQVDIFASREKTLIIENEKLINEETDIVETFDDGSDETERELVKNFVSRNLYFNEIDYRLCDINKIKIEGDILSRGKDYQHLSKRRGLFRKRTKNVVTSTVNRYGELDNTPPIVRTRVPFDRPNFDPTTSNDSFWFIEDKPVVQQTTPNQPKPYKSFADLSDDIKNKLEGYYTFNQAYIISWPNTPTPSPTFTATPTVTNTPTLTPTPLPTPTATPSPSLTATQTPSTTPSPSPTKTATPTLTATPTPTPTSTLSPTASITPTPTPYIPTFTTTKFNTFNFGKSMPALIRLEDGKASTAGNLDISGIYGLYNVKYNRPAYRSMFDMYNTKILIEIEYYMDTYWVVWGKTSNDSSRNLLYYAMTSEIDPTKVPSGGFPNWNLSGTGRRLGLPVNLNLTQNFDNMFETKSFKLVEDVNKTSYNTLQNELTTQFTSLQGSSDKNTTLGIDEHITWIEGMNFNTSSCTSSFYNPSNQVYYSQSSNIVNHPQKIPTTDGTLLYEHNLINFGVVDACKGEYTGGGVLNYIYNIKGGPDLSKDVPKIWPY